MLNLSQGELPRQIQENMIVYMRLFAGLPGMMIVDTEETFWFISNKPAPGDIILRANWPADQAEARIDALLADVGQHLDQCDWFVFPSDQPPDLGQRLEARGMPGGQGGNWLWADLTTLGDSPNVPNNFHIKYVANDGMMREWIKVSEAGFGESLSDFYDAYSRHGYGDDAYSLHYLGYLGETPVTSGTLLDAGGCGVVYDISTPPEFRRQGFGGAITHRIMQEIRRRGHTDTWIWSSNLGQSVYQKLGFINADFGLREHTWKNPYNLGGSDNTLSQQLQL